MPTKPTFVHIHLSGLWDASDAAWNRAVELACRIADVVTVTETTLDKVRAPAGWTKIHFNGLGRNECTILYREAVFGQGPQLLPGETWCVPISKTPYALGSGKVRPRVHLLGAELDWRDGGMPVNFEVFHTPSAVEGKNGLVRGVRRVKALLECLGSVSKHRKAELKGEASVISADWNLNLRLAWVRALLRTRLRGFRNAWRNPLPHDGTHGPRIIDGPRFTRQLEAVGGGSRVGHGIKGFDHRMVITVFRAATR